MAPEISCPACGHSQPLRPQSSEGRFQCEACAAVHAIPEVAAEALDSVEFLEEEILDVELQRESRPENGTRVEPLLSRIKKLIPFKRRLPALLILGVALICWTSGIIHLPKFFRWENHWETHTMSGGAVSFTIPGQARRGTYRSYGLVSTYRGQQFEIIMEKLTPETRRMSDEVFFSPYKNHHLRSVCNTNPSATIDLDGRLARIFEDLPAKGSSVEEYVVREADRVYIFRYSTYSGPPDKPVRDRFFNSISFH